MTIWAADVGLLIHGKYFLHIMEFISYNSGDVSGIVRVKFFHCRLFFCYTHQGTVAPLCLVT